MSNKVHLASFTSLRVASRWMVILVSFEVRHFSVVIKVTFYVNQFWLWIVVLCQMCSVDNVDVVSCSAAYTVLASYAELTSRRFEYRLVS